MRMPWTNDVSARDRLAALRALPELAAARDRDLRALLAHFDEVWVPAGTPLARRGRPATELVVVVEGHLVDDGGRALGAGQAWGWEAMTERGLNPASLAAGEPSRLLVMGRAQFRALRALPSPLRSPSPSVTADGRPRRLDGAA